MKKHLLLITVAFATSFAMAQSIPNGGFEVWTSQSCRNPQFYGTSNLQTHGGSSTPGPVNVIRTTDAFADSFAVKMTTTLVGTDTSQGYIINFNPNGSTFTGGIPYSQQPTSLRFRYKCNVMPGDTALLILFFKKSGTVFSQNIKKIVGTQSTYALGTMTLSLSMAPDSIMFAAAASNVMVHNFQGIPGSMLQIDSVNFGGVSSQPANMNGDFENWTTYTTNPNLTSWNIGGSTINNQTTDKFAGNYALELESTQTNNTNDSVYASSASTGYYTGGPAMGGYPYAKAVDTLKFEYKYAPVGNDSASVSLQFKKAGVSFAYQSMSLPAASSYTQAVMSFSLSQTPDTVIVYISSSKRNALPISYLGSTLKVDNMIFASQAMPVTNFTLQPMGCLGQAIQLTDMSSNIPTTWTWTTTGGNPASANVQNPTVTYTNTGTYTVTLNTGNSSGNGTPVSQTITINPLPTVTVNSATICAGTTATLTAGGTATSFTWNTAATTASITATPTVMTNYTVTGTDANGCMNWATATINVNALPTLSVTATAGFSVCPNTRDTLKASGTATSYTWNTTHAVTDYTVHPNNTTTYTLMGIDANGCKNTMTQVITVYPRPTLTVTASSGTVCAGSPTTLSTVTGTVAVTSYSWSTSATTSSITVSPALTSTYSVLGTSAEGCSTTKHYTVTVNSLPTVTAISNLDSICIGGTDTLTADGATTYIWNTGANTTSIPVTLTVTTTFTVEGTDGNGCQNMASVTQSVSTTCYEGIERYSNSANVSVYPNPSNGNFVITTTENTNTIMVTDILGNELVSINPTGTTTNVNLSAQPSGVYFIKVTANGAQTVKRIIINN